MGVDNRKARAAKLVSEGVAKYGDKAAIVGHTDFRTKYWSSGSLTLDYMLGTGGFPGNAFVEGFGPPEIGKTTILGSGVLRSVHQAGGITATIATEPDWDERWLEKHGVDPDLNIIYRPDTGEEAFAILRDLIYNKSVDYILWDSLGGTSSEKEQGSDKPQAFGNAAMNSWGIRNVATRAWKNNVGCLFINQIRDDTKSRIAGMVSSPGGHTLHHFMKIRLQLKPGKNRYKIKVPSALSDKGTEDLVIGQEVRAVIQKDKAAEQLGPQAAFDFYHIDTNGEYPFGVDVASDVFNVGMVTGVIKGSGWLNHPSFPDGKINGKPKAREFLDEHPDAVEAIRKDVLAHMVKKEAEAASKARTVKKEQAKK